MQTAPISPATAAGNIASAPGQPTPRTATTLAITTKPAACEMTTTASTCRARVCRPPR